MSRNAKRFSRRQRPGKKVSRSAAALSPLASKRRLAPVVVFLTRHAVTIVVAAARELWRARQLAQAGETQKHTSNLRRGKQGGYLSGDFRLTPVCSSKHKSCTLSMDRIREFEGGQCNI